MRNKAVWISLAGLLAALPAHASPMAGVGVVIFVLYLFFVVVIMIVSIAFPIVLIVLLFKINRTLKDLLLVQQHLLARADSSTASAINPYRE